MSVDFEPRVALASLSGQSDAAWVRAVEEHVGAAFLGGIAVDERSRAAARKLVARGRDEFLPTDPLEFVEGELASLESSPVLAGFNVRSATVEALAEAAAVCADHDAPVEVNAHCRQDELCAVGCGETLLRDADRLAEYVAAAVDTGATVSVKVRAEVPGVDLVRTARTIESAGAEVIHVDAMDTPAVLGDVVAATDLFVVANNGVRGPEAVAEYMTHGVDAVSVGRASDDPAVLRAVAEAVTEW
ncbi:MAG: tRNA-dihydrouridine synthase [Halobacteriota archaeon]